ncbi:MAG: hypothetical protein WCF57_11825, partial [Pyrinomonadaceae bacterium]
ARLILALAPARTKYERRRQTAPRGSQIVKSVDSSQQPVEMRATTSFLPAAHYCLLATRIFLFFRLTFLCVAA